MWANTPVSDGDNELLWLAITSTQLIDPVHLNALTINKSLQFEIAEAGVMVIRTRCTLVYAFGLEVGIQTTDGRAG